MIKGNPFIYATEPVCGVDYSLRCPALCVVPATSENAVTLPFASCEFYFLTDSKHLAIDHGNIHGTLMGAWDCQEERYETIAEWVINILKKHNVKSVGLEDYAYSKMTNTLTQLAENGGILKWFLHQASIHYNLFSPSSIKKFATGNGRSVKSQMYDAWIKDTGIDLNGAFGREVDSKPRSPVSDMVDAYYIAMSQRVDMAHTNYHYKGEKKNEESSKSKDR